MFAAGVSKKRYSRHDETELRAVLFEFDPTGSRAKKIGVWGFIYTPHAKLKARPKKGPALGGAKQGPALSTQPSILDGAGVAPPPRTPSSPRALLALLVGHRLELLLLVERDARLDDRVEVAAEHLT